MTMKEWVELYVWNVGTKICIITKHWVKLKVSRCQILFILIYCVQ